MPVGPGTDPAFVADSLESIRHFVPSSRLVVMDDTGEGRCDFLRRWLDTTVIATPKQGYLGGLYRTLSRGFEEALHDRFDMLLKIDTDALIAGDRFVQRAHNAFTKNPMLGCLGVHTRWYDGSHLNTGPVRYSLTRGLRPRAALKNPRRAMTSAELCFRVLAKRRALGGVVFGGVCVYSERGIRELRNRGFLGANRFAGLDILEDHLFGALLSASGFELGDLDDGGAPLMGATWKELPASPHELLEQGIELIHSTRRWRDLDEGEIRAQFEEARV